MMDFAYPFPCGQYSPALAEAPGGVLEDWEVFWGLAERLNPRLRDLDTGRKPTTDQILDTLHAASHVRLDEVRKRPGGHVWGARELKHGRVIPDMVGHAERRMAAGHPEVIAELAQVRAEPVIDAGGYDPGERFAFRLITYRMREVYCTQGQNLPSLRSRRPWNPVRMNPGDMASLGLEDGDTVQVESGHGRLVGTVEATEDLKPGVVAMAFGWGAPLERNEPTAERVQRAAPHPGRPLVRPRHRPGAPERHTGQRGGDRVTCRDTCPISGWPRFCVLAAPPWNLLPASPPRNLDTMRNMCYIKS